MTIQDATKQLNKVKEIFEHLKYHGWINDIKEDIDTNNAIEAINTVLTELEDLQSVVKDMQDELKHARR